ncbi:DVU_1557 family redox protein [Desulfovibrio sp. UCD-KL4C]|uniref:DVU_1557 family redox protein n=1 Tax=Desulfovibrio sp. UCD-KL4C TaxID=2578120 RepID=UPI0025B99C57|nr:CLJU_RS11820 family redox protein [Desulfovibrio sp. UCD-KL4C]
MSTLKVLDGEDFSSWKCAACGEKLVPKPIELGYLESRFKVELPSCPVCGLVLIPEDLALGKMAEVESLLEDK